MIHRLERVVVAVDDPSQAVADYARLLGLSPGLGGEGEAEREIGDCFALRNTVLQLVPRSECEVAGATPEHEGVAALVFREDRREDGPEEGIWLPLDETRGIPIGLLRDVDDLAPSTPSAKPEQTAAALDHVVIASGDLDAALALYGGRLGLRLALDRSFEQRGLRILFFRVGGTTVEVVGALPGRSEGEARPAAAASERDRFGGLAWEVADVRGMRERLAGDAFDVSELRTGHKPGTEVCTVRAPTHGVPTLLKGPELG